jgi:hypothetical protein
VLVSITCVGEHSLYIGDNSICVGEYSMCW